MANIRSDYYTSILFGTVVGYNQTFNFWFLDLNVKINMATQSKMAAKMAANCSSLQKTNSFSAFFIS